MFKFLAESSFFSVCFCQGNTICLKTESIIARTFFEMQKEEVFMFHIKNIQELCPWCCQWLEDFFNDNIEHYGSSYNKTDAGFVVILRVFINVRTNI